MAANAYATVDELKDFLCLTDNDRDYALDNVLGAASRWIDLQTGHRFYPATAQTRYYTWPIGSDPMKLEIDEALAVTSLQTDANGDGVYETTWSVGTDYYLAPVNAPAKGEPYTCIHRKSWAGRYWFPGYDLGVSVTGTFGYSLTTPVGIKQLCLIVSELAARPVLDMAIPGVDSYKLGPDLTVRMSPDDLPLAGRVLLSLYSEQTFVVV